MSTRHQYLRFIWVYACVSWCLSKGCNLIYSWLEFGVAGSRASAIHVTLQSVGGFPGVIIQRDDKTFHTNFSLLSSSSFCFFSFFFLRLSSRIRFFVQGLNRSIVSNLTYPDGPNLTLLCSSRVKLALIIPRTFVRAYKYLH